MGTRGTVLMELREPPNTESVNELYEWCYELWRYLASVENMEDDGTWHNVAAMMEKGVFRRK